MRMKKILIIGFAICVAAVGGLFIFLSSYDYSKLTPIISEQISAHTGREVTLGDNIRLKLGMTPTLVLNDVRLANASWGSKPEMLSIKHLEVEVALKPLLSRKIEVKRLVLVEPDILLEIGKDGAGNWIFGDTAAENKQTEQADNTGKDEQISLAFNDIHIEKATFTWRDISGKKTTIRLKSMDLGQAAEKDKIALKIFGDFNKSPFTVQGTVGDPAALMAATSSGTPFPLDLKAELAGTTLDVKGTVGDLHADPALNLTLAVAGKSLPKLGKIAGITDLPDAGPFALSMALTNSGLKNFSFAKLAVSAQGLKLNGDAQLDLSASVPKINGTFTADSLDLRPLLPQDTHKEKEPKEKIFPDTPLPLDGLKAANGTIHFSANKLILPLTTLTDLDVSIALNRGRLSVNPLSAKIGAGTINGQLELEPIGKMAGLKTSFKVKRFNLKELLGEKDKETITGTIDAEWNLSGKGATVAELMGNLSGKTMIVMGEGKIHNKYISLLGTNLAGSLGRILNPVADHDEYMEGNCFVSSMDIQDGLARSTSLVFDTPSMSVVGSGTVNLASEKLDISLKPAPKKGVANLNLSLTELAKPFKLGGTLAKPSMAIDTTQAALTIGKAVGGALLFGPVGIAAALVGSSADDENPCLAAIDAAKTGKPAPKKESSSPLGVLEKAGKGIGGAIKGLFGR